MGVNYLDGNHNQTDEFDNSCLKACSVVRSYKFSPALRAARTEQPAVAEMPTHSFVQPATRLKP